MYKIKKLFNFFIQEKETLGLFLCLSVFFLYFQLNTIYGGDSGDYVSAAATWGIPHPPGYPLYTLLASLCYRIFAFTNPVWRVGLLSSLPSVLALIFFYKTLKIFFSKSASVITVFTIAWTYPLWLYSEAVEVFSFNNLFIAFLSYFAFKYLKTNHDIWLKLFYVVLGLSLAHHHTILFLIPAIWLVLRNKIYGKSRFLLLIIPGLLFYIYLIIASQANPAVNWGNPNNLKNLADVIIRRGYGTFVANLGIDNSLWGRFLSILAFTKFFKADFNFVGILLVILGFFSIFLEKNRLSRLLWKYSFLAFGSYIFFLFYASFKLQNDFSVATYERFLIAPYFFTGMFICFGINYIEKFLKKFFKLNNRLNYVLTLFYLTLIIVLPINNLARNYPKITILKDDQTMENFSKDILSSAFPGGIVFLASDTTWFNTAYIYYSLGYKNDEVKLINWFSLSADYYQKYVRKQFPELVINKTGLGTIDQFIKDNWENPAIYIAPAAQIENFILIPYGLLYKYFPEEKKPEIEEIIKANNLIWNNFQNPLSGSLGKYRNLFLADVLNYYAESSRRLAEYLLNEKQFEEAEKYLNLSLTYVNDPESKLLLGRIFLERKKCKEAEDLFLDLKKILPGNPFPDAYLAQVYLNCFADQSKAGEMLDSCFQKELKLQIPLEKQNRK